MHKEFLAKNVATTLKHAMVCSLTGRLLLPGEKINLLLKYKKKYLISFFDFRSGRMRMLFITVVPFIPEQDWALYLKEKKAMGLVTNATFC